MSGFLTGRTSLTTVQTGDIAADAVTAAKLPDDVIDSEHYAAGSIDSAHLADDAVTLAKMVAGTDGVIITYDASGNPVHVGPGSDGEVLTSTGAGSPPAFEAAGGGGLTAMMKIRLASNQSISHNTQTKVNLDTLDLTYGSGLTSDIANDQILVDTAGSWISISYWVYFSAEFDLMAWSSGTDPNGEEEYMFVQGASLHVARTSVAHTKTWFQTTSDDKAISLYVRHYQGGSQDLSGGSNYTFLQVSMF